MRCKKCGYEGVNMYVRDGAGGKRWLKTEQQYCKYCKKIIRQEVKENETKGKKEKMGQDSR